MPKSIADQVRDLQNTRAAKAARMEAIVQKSIDEGRSMDESETEEFDTLENEVKTIDADLVRLDKLDKLMKAAKPVAQAEASGNPRKSATESRETGPMVFVPKHDPDDKFKGQSYVRLLVARTLGQLRGESPIWIAQKRWGKTHPMLMEVLKAAVNGHGSGSGEAGAELVAADNRYTGDFIEFLYSRTVYDQLPFREVPANVNIKGQDGAGTGYWVGESKAIPATKLDFMNVTLTPLKVGAVAVCSIEWLEDSTPSGELLLRDGLGNASAQRIDSTVFSTNAAVSGVSPAGLLNGVSAIGSTGVDGQALTNDIGLLYDPFVQAKNASGLEFVMNTGRAKKISLIKNALGQKEFPDLKANGGLLEGDRAVTGDNINAAHLILLKPSDIYKIGDSGVEVYMSRDATIEQNDDPSGETDTATGLTATNATNMFQEHSVAFKVIRRINFAKRRAHAVQLINDAAYGEAESP